MQAFVICFGDFLRVISPGFFIACAGVCSSGQEKPASVTSSLRELERSDSGCEIGSGELAWAKVSYEKFECLLVGPDNMYCAAEVQSAKKNPKLAVEARKRYTEEPTWTMKCPTFSGLQVAVYFQPDHKKVANLQSTKMTKMDAKMDGKWFAEPGITLAQCADLQGNQIFDCVGPLKKDIDA